ncbi:hypothetical protein [Aeromicrobium sp. Root472D3]|uniref:hypothetical protein n=1 Tax=Aeromicrobium sp. Root472D3 TaxID=1736540 RepID=UPI0006FA931D|nr:hypothetical protein [Aeromicrobium sp. Root472D3]KQX73787.1 hypothetical protein ASD10_00485 [Aeromicrobium sp. Root472D3]
MDLMDVSDTAFVVGVLVAPLVAVLMFAAVVATRRSARVVALTSVLSAAVVGSLFVYWWLWGAAFDAVDAGREVSSTVDRTMGVAVGVSAVSAVLLATLGVAVVATSRRRRRPTPSWGSAA